MLSSSAQQVITSSVPDSRKQFISCSYLLIKKNLKMDFHSIRCIPIRNKIRGAAHFAAHSLHVGNGVGFSCTSHGNFAMQIRLPTSSI